MNHTLLSHHTYPIDYNLSSENEYVSPEKPYSASNQFSTSDFFQNNRKANLMHHSSSLALPIHSGFRQHSNQDIPLHAGTSSFLLSPPESLNSSLSPSSTAPSSNLSRFFTNNASSGEHYSNAPSVCLPQPLFDSNMSDFSNRARVPAPYNSYPPSSSPSLNYTSNNIRPGLPIPLSHGVEFGRPPLTVGPSDFVSSHRYSGQSSLSESRQWLTPSSFNNMSDTRSSRQTSPPFDPTKILKEIVNSRGQHVSPEIQANIPKGFFEVEGKWTCYRRNYFPVSCSFTVKPALFDGIYYLQGDSMHQSASAISQFAVSISAKTAVLNNQESQSRGLVQHTPKRDKATESTPGKVIIQPASPTSVDPRPSNMHPYSSHQHISPSNVMLGNYESYSGGHQQLSTPTQYTFERIQFQKATANNGKRRAQQQFFHVVVELWVDIGSMGKSEWVQIATRQSAQMVVRGRSPGHYKDNGRRDSNTSMDPDHGSGAGGDGLYHGTGPMLSGHALSAGAMGDWSHTGNQYRGGGTYHQSRNARSPRSENSPASPSESPLENDTGFQINSELGSPSEEIPCKAQDIQYDTQSSFGLAVIDQLKGQQRLYEEEHSFVPSLFERRRPYPVERGSPIQLNHPSVQVLSVS